MVMSDRDSNCHGDRYVTAARSAAVILCYPINIDTRYVMRYSMQYD